MYKSSVGKTGLKNFIGVPSVMGCQWVGGVLFIYLFIHLFIYLVVYNFLSGIPRSARAGLNETIITCDLSRENVH